MKPLLGIAAALAFFAATGAAQDNVGQKLAAQKAQAEIDQMLRGAKVLGIEAAIMGPAVKGAPYSADEIHETNQTLADGTKIHNETKTTIYRDGQGRVRRESPGQVMIWDSAAGASYVIDQSTQTAQKMHIAVNYVFKKAPNSDGEPEQAMFKAFHFSDGGETPRLETQQMIVVKGMEAQDVAESKAIKRGAAASKEVKAGKKEALPSQIMEGVTCDGTRVTNTIEAGAIGNDRPIQSIEERWYSPELQVNLLVRKSDPRTGEDTVRLTNVRPLEPDPSLFTVPPGYQVK